MEPRRRIGQLEPARLLSGPHGSTAPLLVVDRSDHHLEARFGALGSEMHMERLCTLKVRILGPVHDIPRPAHHAIVRVQPSNLEHCLTHWSQADGPDEAVHPDLVVATDQTPTEMETPRILVVER